jgi:galactokinase
VERGLVARAPGRVNLIGEHTDYQEGWVLPVAISLETRLRFTPTGNRKALVASPLEGRAEFDLDALGDPPREDRGWIDYAKGMAWALERRGVATGGFEGVIEGDLPVGAGLSSSAAFELVAGLALTAPEGFDPRTLAEAAHEAETGWVGVMSGVMDQFACALGRAGHAMLLDCRTLDYRHVALPEDVAIVVCHSGETRTLASSAYGDRRAACEEAARLLSDHRPEMRTLRDLSEDDLPFVREALPAGLVPIAEHVITENARVLDAVAALETIDLASLGELLTESHRSLRDHYQVSTPALDALVDIPRSVEGVIGSRLTGAGFGGCTVTLAHRGAVTDLERAIQTAYERRTSLHSRIWRVESADGASMT